MKTETKKVTVKGVVAKTPENPDGEVTRAFECKSYETSEDVLAAISTPETLKDFLSTLNYGYDLKQRTQVRQQILDANQGPEKGIEKLAKDLIKIFATMGQTLTLEQAMEKAKGMVPAAEPTKAA